MIRLLELPPDLARAAEQEEPVRVQGSSGIFVIIREETLERMRRQLVEEESDRSFFESDGELPLES